MGSNTIIAIVVGAILVIVGFALWPVLNGASNSLYSYFRDSCDDGNGNRFLRAYVGDDASIAPVDPDSMTYYYNARLHGGPGNPITGSASVCTASVPDVTINEDYRYYNEQGDLLGTAATPATLVAVSTGFLRHNDTGGDATINLESPYVFIQVAPILQRFSGINNLLLTVIPVVSVAGFLGISGAKLYAYGKGTSSIGSSISTSIFTLIGIVVAMVIAGPIMASLVDAHQVVNSGQYQVNGTFGTILTLLFAMIPVVYIAGLVTLVGLQARAALMGNHESN